MKSAAPNGQDSVKRVHESSIRVGVAMTVLAATSALTFAVGYWFGASNQYWLDSAASAKLVSSAIESHDPVKSIANVADVYLSIGASAKDTGSPLLARFSAIHTQSLEQYEVNREKAAIVIARARQKE